MAPGLRPFATPNHLLGRNVRCQDEELSPSNGSQIQLDVRMHSVVGWRRNRAHENCGFFGRRKMRSEPNARTGLSQELKFNRCQSSPESRMPSRAILVKEPSRRPVVGSFASIARIAGRFSRSEHHRQPSDESQHEGWRSQGLRSAFG
jgi:hypothetical protein